LSSTGFIDKLKPYQVKESFTGKKATDQTSSKLRVLVQELSGKKPLIRSKIN